MKSNPGGTLGGGADIAQTKLAAELFKQGGIRLLMEGLTLTDLSLGLVEFHPFH